MPWIITPIAIKTTQAHKKNLRKLMRPTLFWVIKKSGLNMIDLEVMGFVNVFQEKIYSETLILVMFLVLLDLKPVLVELEDFLI